MGYQFVLQASCQRRIESISNATIRNECLVGLAQDEDGWSTVLGSYGRLAACKRLI